MYFSLNIFIIGFIYMYVDPSFSQDLKEGVKKILFFFLYLLRNTGF